MKLHTLFIALAVLVCAPARAGLVHRWSFTGTASTAAPAGTTQADSVSGAVMTVRGNGAVFNASGTGLALPGTTTSAQTDANIAAYLNLPNYLITKRDTATPRANLTVEIWATVIATKAWQRIFDFGRMATGDGLGAAGEWTGATAPAGSASSDDLMLAVNRGTTANTQQLAARLDGAAELTALTGLTLTAGTQYHFVATVTDGAGSYGANGAQVAWYLNGTLATTLDMNFHLSSIEDVNNWLGRSQFNGDSNANISYNEFRLYDHAMSAAEISASLAAGPDPLPPTAQPDSATMHAGQKVRIAVLANDTGNINTGSVTVVQAPQFGTAVPDANGKTLYTHTTGSPTTDTFTYRVSGAGGLSSPATVTINFATTLRIANSTLNVPATPPTTAVQLNAAFGALSFTQPVCMASQPESTLRLYVCEKTGLLKVVPDVTATPTATTFLDLPALLTSRGEAISTNSEQGLLSVAFHPNYATNRYFYIFYSVTISGSVYERVSRFTTQAENANAADTTSELVLIQQLDEAGNHNGGDMHFGPDGYLYISVGDEGNQNDSLNNSQNITKDFFSAILRIDVDKKAGSLTPKAHASVPLDAGIARYAVPADNPFVGATTFNGIPVTPANVRTEFWCVGLRNPWRFSFDPLNGELWEGEVGQDTYEEINVVTKGKNYGWAYREAAHNGPKSAQAPANFDTLYHTPPIYEYVHTGVAGGDANFKGNSVSGGIVYRGTRFPTFAGQYIFSDYVSGNIWSLVRNGANPPTVTRIAGEVGIVAFAADPSNGDVLLADYDNNRILRLTVGTVTGTYPDTLSATGLFADLTDLAPSPGLLPYTPNLPFWSDYAVKSRWFIIPDAASTMTWSKDAAWTFPAASIFVKHFDMEMTRGNPATKKRIETRLLVKNATGAYGVSYRWNDAQTEATLVDDAGADFDLAITLGGSPYTQRWHIPSRAECMACHTPQAGHVLSFTTRQLNLSNIINGFAGNQLTLLQNAGYFANSPGSPNLLPRHLRPNETAYPVEARVRSYLAINCSYCHKTGGTASPAAWDGRPELTLDATGLINGAASNNGGNTANKLIVSGDTLHSIVLNRIAVTNGFTRMPPLASSELDQTNIALLQEWIAQSLPNRQTYDQWRLAQFASSTSPNGDPAADPDGDAKTNTAEFLALTSPLDGGSFLAPHVAANGANITFSFNAPANRSAFVETSLDLANWSFWDVSGNAGLPLSGGAVTLIGPMPGPKQFFRLRLQEN